MKNPYGVFCVAAWILHNTTNEEAYSELDTTWEKATKLYDEFLESKVFANVYTEVMS